ncbi:MAG: hypothetical protein M3328_02830, partial [Chloroflexota bacterium]|nr:hypothetical protein [Chloroflexota bacterium]
YPKVPRLGLNWRVTPELSITGGLYFAITSDAIMAGGSLDAVWQSGDIRAWFSVWADFLLVLRPFHYYIDAGISLGASFRLNLLFTHVTITIHIGVSLEIWGPPFAGKATIDLSIISFTIYFGSGSKQTDTTIEWAQFAQQLLPQKSKPSMSAPAALARYALARRSPRLANALAASTATTDPDPSVLHLNVTNGVIQTISQDPNAAIYVVNGEEFECSITSIIPVKDLIFSGGKVSMAPDSMQPHDEQGNIINPTLDFGVGPTGTQSSDFKSSHTITVTTNEASSFLVVRALQNVPKGLWQKKDFDSNGVPQLTPSLSSTTIPNVMVGARLVPYVPPPDHTCPIDIQNLQYTIDPKIQHFAWSTTSYPTIDTFSTETVAGTINSSTATSNRTPLLAAMRSLGLSVSSTLDVDELADPAKGELLASPGLRLLGEQKA